MKKLITGFLLLLLLFTLTSCNKTNRVITFNYPDDTIFDVKIGTDSFDFSVISAFDEDGNDLSQLIEIDGTYDLNTVGTYPVVLFVFDDQQTKGELNIIINVVELSCEEDNTQDKCSTLVSSISFAEESNSLTEVFIDEFIKLKWEILPTDATNQDITITSSDESIATVSSYGYVFGISEGTVTITISTVDGNFTISKVISVLAKSCIEDPFQTKCVDEYLGDTSRIITLPDENVSGTNYQLVYKNNKIYYEIYVRTFADSNNNNIGDFQGIIDNLPYLKSLGVGGIWLMPIMQSRSDHGYETDDYYEVDNEYGTMLDFKELVSTAKAMGIDVIIDLVVNHMGAYNSIFQDVLKNGVTSNYYDWFTWIDSNDPRFNLKGSWGQTIWYNPFANPHLKKTSFTVHSSLSGKYYAAYFSDWMPDLNYLNQEVIDYIYDVGTWWIEETGVTGYRMDAIAHIFGVNEYLDIPNNTEANIEFLTGFKNHCSLSNPDVYIVGEAWDSYTTYAKYYRSGISAFNFEVSDRIIASINGYLGTSLSSSIQQIYSEISKYSSNYIDAPFLRNHDQERIASIFEDNIQEARLAAEVVLFLPGNPYIYFGDEIGIMGQRTSMVWGDYYDTMPINYADSNVDPVSVQLLDNQSILQSYIDIGYARNHSLALSYGDFIPYSSTGLEGYYRVFDNGEDSELVIVLFNFSSRNHVPIPNEFSSYEILYSTFDTDLGGISPNGSIVLKLPFELLDTLVN